MIAEVDQLPADASRTRFALGCIWAILIDHARHPLGHDEPGRRSRAAMGIAIGTASVLVAYGLGVISRVTLRNRHLGGRRCVCSDVDRLWTHHSRPFPGDRGQRNRRPPIRLAGRDHGRRIVVFPAHKLRDDAQPEFPAARHRTARPADNRGCRRRQRAQLGRGYSHGRLGRTHRRDADLHRVLGQRSSSRKASHTTRPSSTSFITAVPPPHSRPTPLETVSPKHSR